MITQKIINQISLNQIKQINIDKYKSLIIFHPSFNAILIILDKFRSIYNYP
jgi:hypothetical protein